MRKSADAATIFPAARGRKAIESLPTYNGIFAYIQWKLCLHRIGDLCLHKRQFSPPKEIPQKPENPHKHRLFYNADKEKKSAQNPPPRKSYMFLYVLIPATPATLDAAGRMPIMLFDPCSRSRNQARAAPCARTKSEQREILLYRHTVNPGKIRRNPHTIQGGGGPPIDRRDTPPAHRRPQLEKTRGLLYTPPHPLKRERTAATGGRGSLFQWTAIFRGKGSQKANKKRAAPPAKRRSPQTQPSSTAAKMPPTVTMITRDQRQSKSF